jgi:hypothetical protein
MVLGVTEGARLPSGQVEEDATTNGEHGRHRYAVRRLSAVSALAVAFGPGPFLDQSREVALSLVRRGASSEVGARFRGS